MPPFPPAAPIKTETSFTVSLLAAGGDRASVQITDLSDELTDVQSINLRSAIGRLSNAAVISDSRTVSRSIAETLTNPYDEAFAEAQTKLVLVWQNEDQELKSIAVPAPDISYFATDGVSLITPDGGTPDAPPTPAQIVFAQLAFITTALNAGTPTGTYVFLKGYRSKRAGKLPTPRTSRPVVEPAAADVPPPDPGA
jgi:hypothetical protein